MAADEILTTSSIMPPERGGAACPWSRSEASTSHTRARLELISQGRQSERFPRTRGGLSPATLNRVRRHIEAHIEQSIDLKAMAKVARLSVHHFARAFKEAEGVTPHAFVMIRRIERAKVLLDGSRQRLSDVAAACGFADQSHFARCFRRSTGETPRSFRCARRSPHMRHSSPGDHGPAERR